MTRQGSGRDLMTTPSPTLLDTAEVTPRREAEGGGDFWNPSLPQLPPLTTAAGAGSSGADSAKK